MVDDSGSGRNRVQRRDHEVDDSDLGGRLRVGSDLGTKPRGGDVQVALMFTDGYLVEAGFEKGTVRAGWMHECREEGSSIRTLAEDHARIGARHTEDDVPDVNSRAIRLPLQTSCEAVGVSERLDHDQSREPGRGIWAMALS